MRRAASLPWHLVMFASVPALFLFAHNRQFIPSNQLLSPLLVSIAGSAFLWALGSLVLRSTVAAALLVTPLVFALQTYGLLYEAVASTVPRGGTTHLITISAVTLVLGLALAMWTAAVVRWKRRSRLAAFTLGLNAAGAVLVCLNLAVAAEFSGPHLPARHGDPASSFQKGTGSRPDVYCLIVDQYASSAEMSALYGGDAGELERWLETRGFRVARRATSRFKATAQSLDAFLNMGPSRIEDQEGEASDVRISRQIGLEFTTSKRWCRGIRENNVMARFQENGYRIVNIGSWFDCTRYNIHADENVNVYGWGLSEELSALALQASIVRPLWAGDSEGLRKGILRQFDSFVQQRSSPTFVFAHVISPHAPYVFDRDGKQPAGIGEKELYQGQHQFITTRIQQAVETILARPGPAPIILIQSDHGGKIHPDPQYNYRVFSAMRLPGEGDWGWRDDLMLENIFALVFKHLGLSEPS